MTETTQEPTARERAIAAIDAAEKALRWTTSLGRWEPVRDYLTGSRGLVKHQPTGDDLAEFVYPADAEHATLWHPRRIKALIDRDRATLERHKPNPLSDDACPCGWEYDECPESNAVIAFWLSDDHPGVAPLVPHLPGDHLLVARLACGHVVIHCPQEPDAIYLAGASGCEIDHHSSPEARSNEPVPVETTHLIADGDAVTLCCGRTPFELPRTDRITVDPALRTCGLPAVDTDDDACRGEGRGTGR